MGKTKSRVQQQQTGKVQEHNPTDKTGGGLEKIHVSKASYFEWLLDLANIDLAKKDQLILNLRHQLHDKDMQIASLNQQLLVNGLSIVDSKIQKLKQEYENRKKKMEEEAGIPWKEYLIKEDLEVVPVE